MDRATYWDYISLKKSHAAIGLSDWYQDFPDPSDWIGPLFTQPDRRRGQLELLREPAGQRSCTSDRPASSTRPSASTMFKQMQDIIMADAPTAPLYQPTWNGMYGKTTGGYYINPVWIFTFQDYWKTTASKGMTVTRRKASRRGDG